jgi:hypothetical protein
MEEGRYSCTIINLALDGGEWSASRLCRINPPPSAPCTNCGHQTRSGRYGEEKNLFPLPGIEPQLVGRPAHSLVAVPTELFRLGQRWQDVIQQYGRQRGRSLRHPHRPWALCVAQERLHLY